jgi:hypothetical protein
MKSVSEISKFIVLFRAMIFLSSGASVNASYFAPQRLRVGFSRCSEYFPPQFSGFDLFPSPLSPNIQRKLCMFSLDSGSALHQRRMLHSERQQVPDVPSIYFVQPNVDNIKRIATVRRQRNPISALTQQSRLWATISSFQFVKFPFCENRTSLQTTFLRLRPDQVFSFRDAGYQEWFV